ncbi:GNAT family N-acetyltransferase [Aliiroseovarius sp. KMU-50]|uniref:GNAT family N-acetyltransferase n=1 Tax=Aliiroseovarius salicola TaxID=3009082 RepID=A0ABT4VZE6_9RHOB|nr:GNAT family N-acetyltransferase [Aliiroseovarius sp. KMU-50]MDA5093628.1 GNAT family N-acetyltransferase [Aliiroseovarius sp. KMU-50]
MIRVATADDATAIRSLWNIAIRETLITFNSTEKTLEDVRATIEINDVTFVAEEAGEVIGYASYAPFRGGVGYAHTKEHSVMLAEAARGRGVGRALMRAIEAHARANKVHSLIAGISAANPMGEPFHAALGFVKVGVIPEAGQKFNTWHDLVLMQKRL